MLRLASSFLRTDASPTIKQDVPVNIKCILHAIHHVRSANNDVVRLRATETRTAQCLSCPSRHLQAFNFTRTGGFEFNTMSANGLDGVLDQGLDGISNRFI